MNPLIPRCDRHRARAFGRAASLAPLAMAALVAAWCAACSSMGAPQVSDRLDSATGTTVIVLAKPVELVTAESRGPSSDPFAFAAPFDVDRMGNRELYLWVSVPQDNGVPTKLQVLCDARPLDLEAVRLDLARLQLSRAPYPQVAPWSGDWYFRLPSAALGCLASAQQVTVTSRIKDANGEHEDHFAAQAGDLRGFAAFAEHLGGR